jgi:hypothetical protein
MKLSFIISVQEIVIFKMRHLLNDFHRIHLKKWLALGLANLVDAPAQNTLTENFSIVTFPMYDHAENYVLHIYECKRFLLKLLLLLSIAAKCRFEMQAVRCSSVALSDTYKCLLDETFPVERKK